MTTKEAVVIALAFAAGVVALGCIEAMTTQ